MTKAKNADDARAGAGSGAASATIPAPSGLARWVGVLDDWFRIPGTEIRIGLDPIIGFLFPAVGDWLSGASGFALVVKGLRAGVPTVVLIRMLLNITVDALLGAVPFLGDLFDVFFRANRRNLQLIERHETEREARLVDYLLVGSAGVVCVLGALAPLWVLSLLWAQFR